MMSSVHPEQDFPSIISINQVETPSRICTGIDWPLELASGGGPRSCPITLKIELEYLICEFESSRDLQL